MDPESQASSQPLVHCGEVTHPRTQAEAAELSPPSAHPCPQPPSEPGQASRGQVGFYKWVGFMTHPGPLRESPSDLCGSRGFHSSQSTPLAAQGRKESWEGGVRYLVALRGQHPVVLGHEHLQGGDVVVAQVHLHTHSLSTPFLGAPCQAHSDVWRGNCT